MKWNLWDPLKEPYQWHYSLLFKEITEHSTLTVYQAYDETW